MPSCLLHRRRYRSQEELSDDIERAQTRLKNLQLQRETLAASVSNLESVSADHTSIRSLKREVCGVDHDIVRAKRELKYLQSKTFAVLTPQPQAS